MLNNIIQFSIRNKLIIAILTLAWIVWGSVELSRLPIDALPDITSNQVQVITVTPTLASPEVERLITFPVEQFCSSIPGIREIRSISRFGLSVVTIVFNDETDIYWARQQVNEKLLRVKDEIPREAGLPEMAPVTTGLGEIYQYILKPAEGYEGKYSLEDLRTIQDWIVRRQLLGTPGVADVSSFGGKLRQYEVAIRPDRLKSMGITVSDVFHALEKNNQNSGGSYIEKGPSILFIRTEGQAQSLQDICQIPVRSTKMGMPIRIGDIADVRIGHAVRYGAMTYEDKGEVAGAVVLMLKGENASNVIAGISKRMETIRETLPEGIEIETFLDRTKVVNRAISTVSLNLLEGAMIVVFVLVFFLGNLRAGLVVASVIPLSMLFAVGMMNLLDVSGNLMSLGALDFGLIVDGAVIIVEAVLHRIHDPHVKNHRILSRPQMDDIVGHSSSRMMNAAVFGQAIILIVYLPVLSLVGIEGKMFRPMAQTVIFALLGAFILSLTYVPMMSSLVLSRQINVSASFSDRFMTWLGGKYQSALTAMLSRARWVVIGCIAFFILSVWIAMRLGGEFIPELEEGDFAVDARILTGSSLTESVRVSGQAAAVLRKFPEVNRIVTRIGASEIPTDPMPMEMTDIIISLNDKKTWTTADSYDELADTMSKALQSIPGITAGFQYPIQMRFNELIAGARQDVVCKIFGENLDSLSQLAQRLAAVVEQVDGAKDLYVEAVTGLPQIVIHYRRDQLSIFQVDVSDVNRLIRAAYAGDVAGKIYENERRFDLVVRLDESSRTGIDQIRQLLVPTPSGNQVPLYQLADISLEEGPNQIQREDAKRRIIVAFNTRGRDVQSIVTELQQKIQLQMQIPAGYFIRYGGQFENLVEARKRLAIAVPMALLLILILLYFTFRSFKYGVLIFSAIPLSAIGGIFSLWLRDMPFSISAGIGFIALFGVSVLNGIVLITEFNRLTSREGLTPLEAVMQGSSSRLRPVLMTAAVASLGFLPMALSQRVGAEVQRPLATVVIGGLVTATILTLFVLPMLYLWVERRKKSTRQVIVAIMAMAGLISQDASAQPIHGSPIHLNDLLQLAERKNVSVIQQKKMDLYWQSLSSKVFDPPKTLAGLEYGNINSFNRDTRFFISQGFQWPSVYKSNRAFYRAGLLSNTAMSKLKLRDIHYELRLLYYELSSMLEREELLRRLDSIYGRYALSADLKLRTGETGRLAKVSADAFVGQIQLQQKQLLEDATVLQQRISWLLDTTARFIPFRNDIQIPGELSSIHGIDGWHPQLSLIDANMNMKKAQVGIDKSKLSPELNLGYSNLSIIGWQSSDGINQKYYDAGNRFGIFQLSLGIPIFNGAAKARIRAAEHEAAFTALERQKAEKELQLRLANAQASYRKQLAAVEYFQSKGASESKTLEVDAAAGLQSGNISYLEWAMLMEQSVRICMSGLEALQELRKSYAEILYITAKE